MGPVYITSGSKIDNPLLETLAKKASYVRISFPGLDNDTYSYYSRQNKFKCSDAIDLITRLSKLRNKYKRENELLLGVRCCLRPEHFKNIESFTANILKLGVDTFQIVKTITNQKCESPPILDSHKKILLDLSKQLQVTIPYDLSDYFDFRINYDKMKSKTCFSSRLTPILYGSTLIPCTHTNIIKNKNYHYGDVSTISRISTDSFMIGKCDTCCSIKDNEIFNQIFMSLLDLHQKGRKATFILE